MIRQWEIWRPKPAYQPNVLVTKSAHRFRGRFENDTLYDTALPIVLVVHPLHGTIKI